MQLSQVKISNLFHFPYVADFSKTEGIQFFNPDKSNVNVLIGPNGAGKSSFLNVINRIWKIGLTKDYIFDKSILLKKNAKQFKNVITLNTLYVPKSHKHYDFSTEESRVWIEFVLTNHDYENIGFITKYREKINAFISKYSNFDFQFSRIDLNDIRHIHDKVAFEFIRDVDKKTITVVETGLNTVQKFVLDYFRNIELVQICVDIFNEFESGESEKKRYPLKNSFAILGVDRKLQGVSNQIDPERWYTYISSKDSTDYDSYMGYFLCAKKIWNILNYTSEENILKVPSNSDFSQKTIEKKLKKSDFFKSLVFVLNKYLNKNLLIEYINGKLAFRIIDDLGHRFAFDDLSDGEQSLLIIIFTIYGYDLKYGTLIIDEPEIYFHPQMQRSFVRMVEKISSNIGTQFLISTYSPLFVDDVNIGNVYRFAKVNGNTTVQNPHLDFSSNESILIHLLKFENMSKIFFVNKIIMVEGETDEYFFEFYLKYLHTFPERKDKLTDYEIININGKGAYHTWRGFLSKFGISSYFIGDRDNVVDFNILTQNDLSSYYKQSKKYMYTKNKQTQNADPYYSRLVQTIKGLYPVKYDIIIKKIDDLYKDDIYILERGDIETYLGMKQKGLEEMVIFCHQHFQDRLKNKRFDSHRRNFRNILEGIFK